MKAANLVELLQVSNYKEGMNKEVIRNLAERFKILHEAFNRIYELNNNSSQLTKSKKNTTIA